MSETEAIVFDIGRVLITWDPEGCYDRWIGEDRRRALFDDVPLYETNLEIDRGEPFREAIVALAEAHPDWSKEIMFWHDRWAEMVVPPIPGSVALLERLVAGPRPVHALTNFGRETFVQALELHPFLTLFDRTFVSGRLGLVKPDPAIYAAVEEGLGLSGPAIFFTDDSRANIAAARARGWDAHLFEGPEGLETALTQRGLL